MPTNARLPRSPRGVRRRGFGEIFHDKSRVTHLCVDRDFLGCSSLWSLEQKSALGSEVLSRAPPKPLSHYQVRQASAPSPYSIKLLNFHNRMCGFLGEGNQQRAFALRVGRSLYRSLTIILGTGPVHNSHRTSGPTDMNCWTGPGICYPSPYNSGQINDFSVP